MSRLLTILFLCGLCLCARGANPAFSDFNPTQFSTTGNKISLSTTVPTTNVTVINLYVTTNVSITIFSTNITTESILNTTNISQTTFVTNLYATVSYISNFFANYFTVYSNANIVGYVRDFNGIATNTTIYSPILVAPVYSVSSNGVPATWLFLDADNATPLAGFDTNRNGFFGNGGGLTNLQGIITSPGSTFGWIIVTNAITNLNLTASTVVRSDANKALASVANSGGVLTNDASGGVGFNSGLRLAGDLFANSLTSTNGITNRNLTASTVVSVDANKAETSIANGGGALTNNGSGGVGFNSGLRLAGDVFANSLTSTNGITNRNLTASTILSADANKAETSVANAAGVLTNDAAGGVGFNSGLRLSGDVYTASMTVTNGMTNRSLTASQFVVTDANKAEVSSLNGSTLTNITYQYTTNALNGNFLAVWGQAMFTNISANSTMTISAPANAFYETCILFITNSTSTDRTLTFPNGVWGSPGSGTPPVYYCTNKMLTTILIQHYGQQITNAIKQDYAP